MAVRMRLMRMGKKKQPMYRVVVVDGRAPRDGRYIEQIGRYEPLHDPSIVEIDNERAASWLANGAQPSETVSKLLEVCGAMDAVKMKTGAIHVVGSLAVADDSEAASSEEETVEGPAGETVESPVGVDTQAPAGETVEAPVGVDTEVPAGGAVESTAGEDTQAPAGETVESTAGEDTQAPAGETVESPAGESEED